jgi:hypothetical protein
MEVEDNIKMKVSDAVKKAHLVAYDGCHKIYLAMDEPQAKWFRKFYTNSEDKVVAGPADEMLLHLVEWWESACPCRFIMAVYTKEDDSDFVELVPQGGAWDESEH